uniref:Serine protease 27-like n=1 Tax=Poecilia formosa TaxID=48698 RepID=A0A096MCR0_POEFO
KLSVPLPFVFCFCCKACAIPTNNSGIIGGQDASPGNWPWSVIFTSFGYLFCQGSLITDQWVLTAARCKTYFLSGDVTLYFGATIQSGYGTVTRRIANFVCYENYTFYNENDICLVKLSAPVNFTNYIRPVCLAAENSTFYNGTRSWAISVETLTSRSIREINPSVLGNTKCNCIHKNIDYTYPITEDVMCVGSEIVSKNKLNGDEGAALVTKKDSIWVQSGILSYTDNQQVLPSIYTRVSQYHKWITDRVTGMEPGFVTYTSPGIDSDLNYTCPPPPSTTQRPDFTTQCPDFTTQRPDFTTQRPDFTTQRPDFTTQRPDFTTQRPTTDDDSVFCSVETLIPIARVFPLSALVLFLHLFVGGAGN